MFLKRGDKRPWFWSRFACFHNPQVGSGLSGVEEARFHPWAQGTTVHALVWAAAVQWEAHEVSGTAGGQWELLFTHHHVLFGQQRQAQAGDTQRDHQVAKKLFDPTKTVLASVSFNLLNFWQVAY